MARIPRDRPVYRLSEPFFDPNDNLHPEGALIAFAGTPNQSMVPMNDMARKAYDAYMDELDAALRKVCEVEKRPFVALARIYDVPEEIIPDASRGANPNQEKPTIRLGNRSKQAEGAEALA